MSKVMYTYQNFKNQIYNTWQKFANKTAVVRLEEYGDRTSLRYAQLLDIAEQIARLLSDSRLGRAYRIAVITPYSAQAVVLNLALAYGGYTAVLIDAALPPDERNRLLEYADVSAVFTIEDIYRGIDKSLLESMPAFMIREDFGFARFPDSVHTVTKTIAEPLNENVIAILFSSGTTGTMKGVQITYHSIMSAWKYMQTYANLDSNVRFLDVLPANHITGYSSTISCSMTGTELGFISQVNAQQLLQGFQTYNPTHFIMIPKIYEVIMQKIQDAIAKKPAPVRWYANFAMSLSGRVRKATGVKMRFLTKPIWKAALGKNMVL